MSGALGPAPRVGVVVEGPGHDVGLVAALKLFAFVVVIVGHVQPKQLNVHQRLFKYVHALTGGKRMNLHLALVLCLFRYLKH